MVDPQPPLLRLSFDLLGLLMSQESGIARALAASCRQLRGFVRSTPGCNELRLSWILRRPLLRWASRAKLRAHNRFLTWADDRMERRRWRCVCGPACPYHH